MTYAVIVSPVDAVTGHACQQRLLQCGFHSGPGKLFGLLQELIMNVENSFPDAPDQMDFAKSQQADDLDRYHPSVVK
jgi:hypothetical protein